MKSNKVNDIANLLAALLIVFFLTSPIWFVIYADWRKDKGISECLENGMSYERCYNLIK